MNARVLILGGAGMFGQRLARHLASVDDIEVIVTSRSEAKAKALASELRRNCPHYQVSGVALNHGRNLQEVLDHWKPLVVVDCSGPFQTAGYDVAKIVLSNGVNLIDLADARDYLLNYRFTLDEMARENNVSGFAGASSTPALSSCVVQHLTEGWSRVDTIDICITPGGQSEVGRSVIEATLSYAGEPVPVWNKGRLDHVFGWAQSRVLNIPGLGKRRVSPVETFDAELLGPTYDVQNRVTFSAGLESAFEQWGMEILGRLRKTRLFPNPRLFISQFLRFRKLTRLFTSDEGSMLVEVTGLNANGQMESAKWSLLAKNDQGPFVPILPAAALIKQLLAGNCKSGAALAFKNLSLVDIMEETTRYDITTETTRQVIPNGLFREIVGEAQFGTMPEAVQLFHEANAPVVWSGKAEVEAGKGLLTNLIARVFGLPMAGKDIQVTVIVDRPRNGNLNSERWTRQFGNREFSSILTKRVSGKFNEQFGPFSFTLDVNCDQTGLQMPVSKWRFLGLPLPSVLAPRSDAREYQDDGGRFNFDVKLTLPLLGLLAHYKGWLLPKTESAVAP